MHRALVLATAPALLAAACGVAGPLAERSAPIVLCEDAGWCWFQDERVLDLPDGTVVFGSVADGRGVRERTGDVQVTSWHPATGAIRTVELADRFERDDHDVPALHAREDGRLVAVYAGHGKDNVMRWRVAVQPHAVAAWGPEQQLAVQLGGEGRGVTYANLLRVQDAAGRELLLCAFRGAGWDPQLLVSEDDGATWAQGPKLLGGPGRPYAKYATDGKAAHFVVTEQHPRDFDNSLWHGRVDGTLRTVRGDGTAVAGTGDVEPQALTRVFAGAADAVAWPCDLELDADGMPVCVFSVQVDGRGKPRGQAGMDHRYQYARFDGTQWSAHEMAFAGTKLYAGEDDYTGLAAIVPHDPRFVFVSTNAHPVHGTPLVSTRDGRRHWEIWRGFTADRGRSWTWEAVTADSTEDQIRPIVPRSAAGSATATVLWLRGSMKSYSNYRLDAVGAVVPLSTSK
ncbi:MAG: hypothetical protein RIT25_2506 [Planctomycetota bacterium]